MPIYEYRCENGHLFEVMQRITDDPVTACEDCGAAVQRVFHPIAVHFKGSGFYNTDYGTSKRKREEAATKSASDSGGDGKKGDGAKPASEKSSSSGGSAGSAD
ncbi:MAG TPA: FmdB family zinc ribbon protein [Solirubrobacteraceae bacterium]|nr:FmdB family zinc ribbon protein [Solirubrobacteraceae bacterium]